MKILELSSSEAVTIFSSVKIVREYPTRALTNIDLENYISQAVWKFFDKCRSEAAERLSVGEMELVLSDVRILGVKIDGHRVINPIGFTGRELEISLSLTVIGKGESDENVYMVEGASMRAYILSRLLNLDRAFYVESDQNKTGIYYINGSDIRYFSGFDWGGEHAVSALQEILEIDGDVLERVYRKYARGDVSERLDRRIGKPFYTNFGILVNGTLMNVRNAGAMRGKTPPIIYFNPLFPVPEGVYRKNFTFGRHKLRFQKPEDELDIETFMKDNIHGVYEDLNDLARRRISWLTPKS
ncbi:MAG: hypothetical protein COT89_02110 [Candidatus Colwellbacteria bacterium CG10_big_fil_rev_8_21_14_0_10_42_22]|uniref:Uncharacterized protein n=1 Tax=Candidatus Colwellbacteria bacterium CG10_big_fil_rev_8_21_14_0_10_42_22 TaxID=1974540 RepID=A0A2H0VFF3_9BACT|nr:MAG: hypothetical protein COT89_02110 [Candidatus Colwellbacteria bacterium CG10_big_fil_rev_8_21_14_0_10_42_22]